MTDASPVVNFDGLHYRPGRLTGANLSQLTRKIARLTDAHPNAYPVGSRWDMLRGLVLAHVSDLAPDCDSSVDGFADDVRPGSELIPAVLNHVSVRSWFDRITGCSDSELRYIALTRPLGVYGMTVHHDSEHINLAAWLLRETGSLPQRPGVVAAPAVLVSKALKPRREPLLVVPPTFDLGPVAKDDALAYTMDTLLADGLHTIRLREIASKLLG